MASSRRSRPADRIARAVGEALAGFASGARVAIALSGGRDSMALADAASLVGRMKLVALHVHHGLSPYAEDWVAACERFAHGRAIPLTVCRVEVARNDGNGLEAAARCARYAALGAAARAAGAQAVMLAHHQDDQAETVLLQLARGAGPGGLAAMPAVREDADGLVWLRPLLEVPRVDVEAWVRERDLAYVDDDSNASPQHRRNALRLRVVPALRAIAPGYPATFARAAGHQADAVRLADDLARLDAQAGVRGSVLDRAALKGLPGHRARNLLRHFLAASGRRTPSEARLREMLEQLINARDDARVRLRHDGAEIGIHRGGVFVHALPPAPFERVWQGETALQLPHGRLTFLPVLGRGLAQSGLAGHRIVVRLRQGGERLRLERNRPRRALKAWLQESGLPPWQRDALPLVFRDEALAAVPGLGVEADLAASPDEAGLALGWEPS